MGIRWLTRELGIAAIAALQAVGCAGVALGDVTPDPSPVTSQANPYQDVGCTPLPTGANHDPAWAKVELQGQDEPGYVGAIAWIGNTGRALAVGGTGVYPRRELGWPAPGDTTDCKSPPPGTTFCDQFGRRNDCGLSATDF